MGINFQQAWFWSPGKMILTDVTCFNSRKYFTFKSPDGMQSSQDSVLSLGMSCESICLLLGVWWPKDRLAVPESGHSNEVEENTFGEIFSKRQNLQVARCDASGLHLQRKHWKDCSTKQRHLKKIKIKTTMLFLFWNISPMISCGSKDSGGQVHCVSCYYFKG